MPAQPAGIQNVGALPDVLKGEKPHVKGCAGQGLDKADIGVVLFLIPPVRVFLMPPVRVFPLAQQPVLW